MPIRKAPDTIFVTSAADVADRWHLARLKQRVAVTERRNDQMMHVGRKEQCHAEHGQEVADQRALLVLGRVHGRDKAKAQLLGNHRTRHFERGDRQPRRKAKYRADDYLFNQQHHHRPERAGVDLVGRAVQWQQNRSQHYGDREPDPRRNVLLAKSRQKHQHGASAGKNEKKGRARRRKERDIDIHGDAPLNRW